MDWGNLLVDQVKTLITAQGTVLVPAGLILLTIICVSKLALMVARNMLTTAVDGMFSGGWHVAPHMSEVLIILLQLTLVTAVLNNYFVLSSLPMEGAKAIVGVFDQATIDNFLGYVSGAVQKMQKPNPIAILDIVVYLVILIDMGIISALMFLVTSLGFCFYGVFVVLGPLFIPCAMTRTFNFAFWGWLKGLLAFASYRVLAAAIGWVWSNMYIYFFVHGVGTDYSIGNWIALLPVMVTLTLGFAACMLAIPIISGMLFSGAGSVGQSYFSGAASAIRAAAAAF